ncbi:MAG: VirB3 family type IV secretion system protein [Neisseria zoodegmatis]|uniref:VirB3 family type IV secretion system protein n=1 Tax=Neisseria zoodegmatis TaxID=326523 RepID=UPI0026EABF35|nr:VirB3 family type IV secretion system protein [Neisseria zoodegmatis]MDO5069408.1 VirB3 family type IV secretion system protein [Neisseria zoodegmatis]
MSNDIMNVDDELPAYRGLERTATFAGMPMVPVVMVMAIPLLVAMILLPFLKVKAFLVLLFSLPCLAFIYTQTQQDDQALRIIGLSTLSALRRRNYRLFGKTNTILGSKYGRQKNDYQRFFEQNTEKTAGSRR